MILPIKHTLKPIKLKIIRSLTHRKSLYKYTIHNTGTYIYISRNIHIHTCINIYIYTFIYMYKYIYTYTLRMRSVAVFTPAGYSCGIKTKPAGPRTVYIFHRNNKNENDLAIVILLLKCVSFIEILTIIIN